jgi:hypothetical protein
MAARNYALFSSALLMMLAVGCSDSSKEESASSDLALVNDIQCNIGRGAFVSKSQASPAGELKVSCPGTSGVTFNGQAITAQAEAFTVTPHDGINIIHVEQPTNNGSVKTNDIAFMYGTFADARTVTGKAISLRLGANGMSTASLPALPLPAGPTNVTLSQIGTQILRDQGNLLGKLDGQEKNVSGAGFGAGVKLVHSSYDPKNATIRLSARDGGLRLEAIITSIDAKIDWHASAPLGIHYDDSLDARVEKIHVSADVDLRYDAASKSIKATLGGHDLQVEGLDLDDVGLGRIPFGIGDGIEDAIAGGAEFLINNLADPLLDVVKDSVLPDLALSMNQFHLPASLDVPFLGGSVDLKEDFDGASFKALGSELSLAAGVLAPEGSKTIKNPGWLTQPAGSPNWDQSKGFGVSLSLDYVNQAFYSVWSQGLLNREIVDHVEMLGIKTGPIVLDAKLPPVVRAAPEGDGLLLNIGELQLNTIYHSSQGNGDAKVRLAVSLVTKAKISMEDEGATLRVMPSGDETTTQLTAQLIGVESGNQAAADELQGVLALFTPYLQTLISNDIDLPPVAIPSVDLGIISPSFAGRDARFNGQLHFDNKANRIVLEGDLLAH